MVTSLEHVNKIWIWFTAVALLLSLLVSFDAEAALPQIPLYGLFETSIINTNSYSNPFADVELNAVFTSPTGRSVSFFGFYDGDGNGGQYGNVWKQRFMPDELGTWTYDLTFSDSSPGKSGSFVCVSAGAKPGPWRQDPANPRWFLKANGERFLPVAMHASSHFTPIDWQDAINWCQDRGYNTLITATFNWGKWGDGWGNVTAWVTHNETVKEVNFDRMNLKMWHEWDDMIEYAASKNIYIGPWANFAGKYGGQSCPFGKCYPPYELAIFGPGQSKRTDNALTERNKKMIRYFVARQGSFWNIAYWSLGTTEVHGYAVASKQEFLDYGEYFASITPWGRLITGQDIGQSGAVGSDHNWLPDLATQIPKSRLFNTTQNVGPNSPEFNEAGTNNSFVLNDCYNEVPVMGTETLWEGQIRARQPLRIIWGYFTAGAHTMWADWRYEHLTEIKYGSIGRGWVPIKPLSDHLFRTDQLGTDCTGDEELKIATDFFKTFEYWKMSPHNELVTGSTEAYCLAEPGSQYMIYTPNGGTVKLDLTGQAGAYQVKWLNPRDGSYLTLNRIEGDAVRTTYAPTNEDWVLFLRKTHDVQAPAAPTNLEIAQKH